MAQWTRQPQERDGFYRFSGKFIVTRGINEELTEEEILGIYKEIQQAVKDNNGIDYLQVFVNEKKEKLFFIDQLNDDMLASGGYKPEHNYCTLMFAHEY